MSTPLILIAAGLYFATAVSLFFKENNQPLGVVFMAYGVANLALAYSASK